MIKAKIPVDTRIMAKLDVKSGYHLLKVHEDSQQYLNFASPLGILRYLRSPMGLRSSNDSFCQITNLIFSEAKDVNLIQSIDDFLICARDLEDLERQLKTIIDVARKYNVVFNIEKLEVGENIVFVGMLIRCSKDSPPIIGPDPKTVEALRSIPEPKTRKELRQFLGLSNALAKYTDEHQRRAEDLYALVPSFSGPKSWTEGHSKIFQNLKKYLCDPSNIIYAYDSKLPLALFTDASQSIGPGFSAILYNEPETKDLQVDQSDHRDRFRPLAMDSTFIPLSKTNLDSTTLELGAIAWALEKFHYLTAGAGMVKVYCDSKSTVNILNKNISQLVDPYQIKFTMLISRYNISPIFIPRTKNTNADLLSKFPYLPASELPETIINALESSTAVCHVDILNISHNLDVSVNTDIRLDYLESKVADDTVYNKILKSIAEGIKLNKLDNQHPIRTLKLDLGALGIVKGRKLLTYHGKIFVPDGAIPDVLQAIHEGHSGVNRCISAAKSSVFWPRMTADITALVQACKACSQFANVQRKTTPSLDTFDHSIAALKPMQNVQADLFEPRQGLVFLILIDKCSNFIFAEKISSKSCKSIIAGLEKIFLHFGCPLVFESDNMSGFAGKELEDYLKARGVTKQHGAPYFSDHQSYAEGGINIVKRLYQKAQLTKVDLSRLIFLHNAFPSSSNSHTPFQVMFDRAPNFALAFPSPDNIPSSTSQLMKKQILMDLRKQRLADRLRPARSSLSIGASVWIYNKLTKQYSVKGTVLERLRNSSYMVEFEDGKILPRHVRHLKRCIELPAPIDTSLL